MSTVTVPNLLVGDAINSKPINTFISSVNGFQATAESFKPEGIDRRNLQSQITHDYRKINKDFSTPIRHTTRTFTPLTHASIPIELGPVTVLAGQAFHVCASFNFTGEFAFSGGKQLAGPRRTASDGRTTFSFMLGAKRGAILTSLVQTRKDFGVIGYHTNNFITNSNCCTLELMSTVSTDTTFTFNILAQAPVRDTSASARTISIDSLNFFYVRYLV